MNLPIYLLIPFVAAAFYALSTMFIKRAFDEGMGLRQGVHLTNIAVAVLISPLLSFESAPVQWQQIHLPLMMAACFYIANWFTVMAIRSGDVSLVTPIMGTKVVFVALGAALILRESLPSSLIFAAILAMVGILVIGIPELLRGRDFLMTLVYTLLSSAAFAACDLMVQSWAPRFGELAFLAVASGSIGLASVFAIATSKLTKKRFRWPRQPARFWAWTGALLVGLQSILIGISLAFFRDATGINVVYASSGLWAIALVWLIGSWFGNHESTSSGRMYLCRVIGSVMLTLAIVMAVMARSN